MKIMKDCSLLFSILSSHSVAEHGFSDSGLDTPISNINQESAPQTCLQVNMIEAFSQLRFSPPR